MKVLALIADNPNPPLSGSRARNCHLWPELRALGVETRVLGFHHDPDPARRAFVDAAGNELFFPDRERLPFLAFRAWNRAIHSYHEWFRSKALNHRLDQLLEEWKPDVLHAEELRMGAWLSFGRADLLRSVTLHNVESDLIRMTGSFPFKFGKAIFDPLHGWTLKRFEARVLRSADIAFTYSRQDLERYRSLYPDTFFIESSNGTPASSIVPSPEPEGPPKLLLFGSLSYLPNLKGLEWFLENVFPRLPGEMQLTVAGSHPSPELKRRLQRLSIRLIDSPPDLAPIFAEHTFCVAPVFEGGGTRGKILDSLAHGRAVVTTPLGISGLDLEHAREGAWVADQPDSFLQAILKIGSDRALRQKSAERGRQAVLERYDWKQVARRIRDAWLERI